MKNNNYEIDKKQLEKVSGGDSGLDPNNMTPEERMTELKKKLEKFMNTAQGQNLGFPDDKPGGYVGNGFGGNPFIDPNALQ